MGNGVVTAIEIRSKGESVEAFIFGRVAGCVFCRHYHEVSAASSMRIMAVVTTGRFADAKVVFDGETLSIVAEAVPVRIEPISVNLFIGPENVKRAAITRDGIVRWHENVSAASVQRLTDTMNRSGVVLNGARFYAGCLSLTFFNRQAGADKRLRLLNDEWRKVYRIVLDGGNLAMRFLAKGIADDCYTGTAMDGAHALSLVSVMLSTETPNLSDFIAGEDY